MKLWEKALLMALAVTFLWGSASLDTQDALSRKMIRMHVLANSDTEADQTLKLQVRDRVLSVAEDILRQSENMAQAARKLEEALPQITEEARQEIEAQGYDYPVTTELVPDIFPTRDYDGFSLPGGNYTALRVIIGEGKGHNWWCVVFPPLCTAAAENWEETALSAGLSPQEVELMTGAEPVYVLKFRSVELWQQFKVWLGK